MPMSFSSPFRDTKSGLSRMAGRGTKEAFVTLATNDTYSLGCLVLGNSIRRTNTTRQLVVMVTDGVSSSMRNQLQRVFDIIFEVDLLDSNDPINLQLLGRPDLNVTFTKLHCWRLTMFDKAVFLDADTLVLSNVDELFDREELSAAPDAGWPDCFNSGVFVFKPSEDTYKSLLEFAISKGSFDGGDQGLLNLYFSDWSTKDINRHLPFLYNVVSQAFYSYLPAFTQFKKDVKIVHFIGATKPWHHPFNTSTGKVQPLPETGHSQDFLQLWWDIFMQTTQPSLDPSLMPVLHHEPPPPSPVYSHVDHAHVIVSSTTKAVFPYVPPNIHATNTSDDHSHPEGHLECHQDSQTQGTSFPHVVDIDVMPRVYTHTESHYSENPMSSVDIDAPPTEVYEVKEVVRGWAGVVTSPNVGTPSHHDNEVESSNQEQTNANDAESIPSNQIDINHNENSRLSGGESGHTDPSLNQNGEQGGLVGQLASLQLMEASGAYQGPSLSDQERKLNWERGQIDYLGSDSFVNIEKKLNESLEAEKATGHEQSTSSVFAPKKTTTTVTITPKPPKK